MTNAISNCRKCGAAPVPTVNLADEQFIIECCKLKVWNKRKDRAIQQWNQTIVDLGHLPAL